MNIIYKKSVITLLMGIFVFAGALPLFAQQEVETPGQAAPSVSEPIQLQNPLGGSDGQGGIRTLPELIEGILRIVLTIGTPIVALAIIYAGFLFITAQGNPTKLQTARQTLMYVLIGGAILLAAYVIAEAVVGTVNAIRGQ